MITFYEQAIGYSHLASGKPCQDNGLHYEKDGVYIAIVCDGHGSETYVRSQDGSRIAANVALEKVLSFIEDIPPTFFSGKKGAVTAQSTIDLLTDGKGGHVDFNSLSESQQEIVLQNKSYIDESAKHPDIEERFRILFRQITDSWYQAIEEDAKARPFNEDEKTKLGSKNIVKAYGTTLMVAVRTQNYWFAFHLGDGKLLIFDKRARWSEPVPWDCNCFLNITTSLCDSSPVSEYRYAFDGTGDFPIAFVLGSDGIDDTFFQPDLLYRFYGQMLGAFRDCTKEKALEYLRDYLPVLSERGSHDDMSIAGIIDESKLDTPLKYYSVMSEVRALNKEKEEKEKEIESLEEQQRVAEMNVTSLREKYEHTCREKWEWFKHVLRRRAKDKEELSDMGKVWRSAEKKEKATNKRLTVKREEYEEWRAEKKLRIDELRSQATKLEKELGLGNINEEKCMDDSPKINIEEVTKNEVSVKKAQAITLEESEKLDKESDEQAKEILNT